MPGGYVYTARSSRGSVLYVGSTRKHWYEDAGAPSYVRVVARARESRDGRVRDTRAGTGRRGRRHLSARPALQRARRPRHPTGRSARAAAASATAPSANAASSCRLPAASPVSPSSGRPRCTSGTWCEHSVRLPCLGWRRLRRLHRGSARAATRTAATDRSGNAAHRRVRARRQLELDQRRRSAGSATRSNAFLTRRTIDSGELTRAEWPSAGVAEQREPRPRIYRRAPRQANGAEASGKDLRTDADTASPTIRLGPCSTRPPRLNPRPVRRPPRPPHAGRREATDRRGGRRAAAARAGQAAQSPHEQQRLPARAEVVVVGGGVMGTSTAFHLAEAGVATSLLLERGGARPAGRRRKAAGGVRAQFSDPLNIALGARSLEAFARFAERPGQEIDLHRGRLPVPPDPAGRRRRVRGGRRAAERAGRADPDARRRRGGVARAGDRARTTCSPPRSTPATGTARPESVVLGYAAGARRHGATVLTGVEVVGLEAAGAAARRSAPPRARSRRDAIVCAAGAWSGARGGHGGRRAAGDAAAPADPRHRAAAGAVAAALPASMPMTIDAATTSTCTGRARACCSGCRGPGEEPGFR